MDAIGGVVGLLIGIAIVVLIFWALREVVSWYWKINQMIELQDAMVLLLTNLNRKNEKQIELQQKILETMLKTFEKNGGEVNWDELNEVIKK
jgi:hypothetical protein